jgi:hypothetical protein
MFTQVFHDRITGIQRTFDAFDKPDYPANRPKHTGQYGESTTRLGGKKKTLIFRISVSSD